MKILITGAGGAAAISVWKSLAKDHSIYMADIDPCAAGLYLVTAEKRLLVPRGDSSEYASTLLNDCLRLGIELLIPTVDTELLPLAKHAAEFHKNHIRLPISSVDTLKRCRDKSSLLSFCEDTGFTPFSRLIMEDTSLSDIPFPCFAKPRQGAGSTGAMLMNTRNELEQLPKDGSYLVQELLSGDEYSVDVYIHSNGQPIAAVPRIRMKIDSGIAVAAQTRINPELTAMALTIAQRAGITYVANVQFKANPKGEFKLLEINPRFPGTLPLTAAAGVDIPRLLIKDLLGEPFSAELLPYKELMVVRYWTEHFFPIEEWRDLCG